jgi:undecaprenyl-diphosphatase
MNLWEAVFCGIIQGLTEFLPVSSSGHLALAHTFFGMADVETHLSFDILLHFATLIVVFVVYHKDIFDLCAAFVTMPCKLMRGKLGISALSETERMALLLVLATIPLAGGLFLKDFSECLSAYPRVVGAMLILNGVLLWATDRLANREGKDLLSAKGALGVGIFQLCATFPGISRSGSTISGGMLFGLSRKNAVKFSFLMSIPAILGANILSIADALETGINWAELPMYLVGVVVAAVTGYLCIRLLKMIAGKGKFGFFAYYCWAVGVLTLVMNVIR